ncbi:MAG: trigger factor, partial [Dehalococcoidia bacterium]|nr:trigger factor [Dehalococcoidia bacterium]
AQPSVEFTSREPLSFRLTVPLEPVVDPGAYRSVSVQAESHPVSDENVDKALEEMAYEQASWEPAEGPVQMGQLVVMDVEATVEGEQVISQQAVQYMMRADPPVPVAGFAQQLEGIAMGEGKEFNLPFPEDYPREELKGKEAAFKVKVIEVKEKHPLPPGEELAKDLGWDSLSVFKEGMAERLRSRAEAEARRELEEKVISEVVDGAKVEFSPMLVEREAERLLREQNIEPNEKVVEEVRPIAMRRLLRSLILDSVAKAEGIEADDQEVAAEVERMSQGQRGEEVRRFFSAPAASQVLKDGLRRKNTVACLVDIATGAEAAKKGGPDSGATD